MVAGAVKVALFAGLVMFTVGGVLTVVVQLPAETVEDAKVKASRYGLPMLASETILIVFAPEARLICTVVVTQVLGLPVAGKGMLATCSAPFTL